MYDKETRKYLETIDDNVRQIDECMTKIKVAMHDLEKLGFDIDKLASVTSLELLLTDVGIPFYKFKMATKELTNEILERISNK